MLITLVNTRAENLFIYQREELLGQSIEILVPQRFRHVRPEHRSGFFTAPSTAHEGQGWNYTLWAEIVSTGDQPQPLDIEEGMPVRGVGGPVQIKS